MQGYTSSTYGDAFADVYDQWYGDLTDRHGFTAMAFGLALADLPVLELGVGTGRLAVPLAEAGLHVVGVDTSAAMLAKIPPINSTRGCIEPIHGDMVDDLPAGPFGLAYCGFNTLFNLPTDERQQACLNAVAQRLAPGAPFIVECSIPIADGDGDGNDVTVKAMTATEVVLSVSRADHAGQRAEGQFISISEDHGVRLRPWAIHWATPQQLDEMAAVAGMELIGRYADYERSPLVDDCPHHVSVYRVPTDSGPVPSDHGDRVVG